MLIENRSKQPIFDVLKHRKRDHDQGFDWMDHGVREALLDYQDFHLNETIHNPNLDLTVTSADFGDQFDNRQLEIAIATHLDTVKEEFGLDPVGQSLVGNTGFEISHWTRRTPTASLLALQIAIAEKIARATLEQSNHSSRQIDSLYLSTSGPESPLLAKYLAKLLRLKPNAKIMLISAACNSTAFAFNYDSYINSQNPDHLSLFVSLETLLARRFPDQQSNWPGCSDMASLSMFSDRATCAVLRPSKFKPIASVSHELKDSKAALAAINPTTPVGQPRNQESILHVSPLGYIAEIPKPLNGQGMAFNPFDTTRLFVRFIAELNRKIVDSGINSIMPQANWAIAHEPSKKLYEDGLASSLYKLGLPKHLLQFCPQDSNSPVNLFLLQLARITPYLQTGDNLFTYFFGAGATGQSTIYQVQG